MGLLVQAGCRALAAMQSIVRVSGGVLCVPVCPRGRTLGMAQKRPCTEPYPPARWGDEAGLELSSRGWGLQPSGDHPSPHGPHESGLLARLLLSMPSLALSMETPKSFI